MSYIVLKSFFQYGVLNPLPFWGGIIKRVAPSAYIVLGATLLASYFIVAPNDFIPIVNEAIASSLQVENLQLMRKAVDYLASDSTPSPVQQFWALSIQIQFYILLPIVILPLAIASKSKKSSLPLFIGVLLIIIFSFTYATISIQDNKAENYFNPLLRAWEFFLGVLIFLIVSNNKKIKGKETLGIIGISLIIGGAILIPREARFPGPIALIPVAGAILIILSGVNGKGLVNKLLSNKALVFLGNISFTIYLWHWPILVLYKYYFSVESVGLLQGTLIIISSIVLAYLTSRVVEFPFRKIPREKVLVNFLVGILFFTPIASSLLFIKYTNHINIKNLNKEWDNKIIKPYSGSSVLLKSENLYASRDDVILSSKVIPTPYRDGCNQNRYRSEAKTCEYGVKNSDKTIVLVGSSHALQWLPALIDIANDNNLKIINMTKDACSLGAVDGSDNSCYIWNENVINEILNIRPDAVITNSTKTSSTEDEFIPKSYIEAWSKISSNGISIIGIRDNPRFDYNIPECIHRENYLLDNNKCSMGRDKALLSINPAKKHSKIVKNIDMSDMFCTDDKCLSSFSKYIIYRDTNHISLPYVKFIRGALEDKMKDVLPELF